MFKKVYSTKINVVANFGGSIWTALLSIFFVRLYFNYIDVEAYGLIGFFSTIQSFIFLLDFGVSATLSRELARLSPLSDREQEMHDIKRTLEIPNWIVTVFIALLLAAAAPLIARYWIQPKNLSVEIVTQALVIVGFNIALSFCLNFYLGGLMGLRKQLFLSVINIICGTLRSAGSLLVLAFVSPTIQAFLLWQGLVTIFQIALMAFTLKQSLPDAPAKGRFKKDLLRNIRRFAIGMTGISFVGLIVTQTDKLILSRMLDLEKFGYYSLAVTIATMGIGMLASSVNHAAYPQLSRFVSVGDERAVREFYHRSCQIMSVLVFSVAGILAFFSYDVILIWIGKEEFARNTYVLLSVVAVGNGLNSLMWLPHSAQLAHGWTKLAFYLNVVTIIFLVPLIGVAVYYYGAIGAAAVWAILNFSYFFTVIPLMHRRILKGEQKKWFLKDLSVPFAVAVSIAGIGRLLLPAAHTRYENVLPIAVISAATLLLTALATETTRNYLTQFKDTLLARLRRDKIA